VLRIVIIYQNTLFKRTINSDLVDIVHTLLGIFFSSNIGFVYNLDRMVLFDV